MWRNMCWNVWNSWVSRLYRRLRSSCWYYISSCWNWMYSSCNHRCYGFSDTFYLIKVWHY